MGNVSPPLQSMENELTNNVCVTYNNSLNFLQNNKNSSWKINMTQNQKKKN
jgi:hypothetical protein